MRKYPYMFPSHANKTHILHKMYSLRTGKCDLRAGACADRDKEIKRSPDDPPWKSSGQGSLQAKAWLSFQLLRGKSRWEFSLLEINNEQELPWMQLRDHGPSHAGSWTRPPLPCRIGFRIKRRFGNFMDLDISWGQAAHVRGDFLKRSRGIRGSKRPLDETVERWSLGYLGDLEVMKMTGGWMVGCWELHTRSGTKPRRRCSFQPPSCGAEPSKPLTLAIK